MKKSILARNTQKPNEKGLMQSFTINLLPKLVRHDSMEDREYIVVPMVILTEGVHSGSDGPLYYPKEELSKTPAVWNHKPVVVYHPEMNGMAISACDPDVITNRKVGVMMNTKFKGGRLTSEAWIEADRANKVDPRIMEAVEKNEMMELSTGVFVDCEQEEGEWKGETYNGIARNYRPDHLALLPDKIGACSISDGAGFLRNESSEMMAKAKKMMAKAQEEGDEEMMKEAQAMMKKARGIKPSKNEMSFSNISSALSAALQAKLGNKGPYPWTESVYSNFFIYSVGPKLYRLGYTATETGVTLSDKEPVEVVRVTEYRTTDGSFVGNNGPEDGKESPSTPEPKVLHKGKKPAKPTKNQSMNKAQMVVAILAANIGWAETDREQLEAMTDKQVEAIHNGLPKPPPSQEEKGLETPPANNQSKQTTAAKPETPAEQPKVVVLEDYIAAAPAPIQDVLRNSLSVYEEEKQKLITVITSNKDNTFAKESLQKKPLEELRAIAKLAGANKPAANYAGQGQVPSTGTQEAEEPLAVPALNFAKA